MSTHLENHLEHRVVARVAALRMFSTTVAVMVAISIYPILASAQSRIGQSASDRGRLERDTRYRQIEPDADRRTRLVGETITRPTIVQGENITIVTGNVAVNRRRIVESGPGANAAILHVRCPERGGRVIVRGNRIVNDGPIIAHGPSAAAAALLVRCDRYPGSVVKIDVENNRLTTSGPITAESSP